MSEKWAAQFDYRSDLGPLLVGPFDSKVEAMDWITDLTGVDYAVNPTPMGTP